MNINEIQILNTNLIEPKRRGKPPKNKQVDNDLNIIEVKKEKKIKEIKVKKNIEIVKNPSQSIIKVKSDSKENNSMDDALENDKVFLWGLNQIDSILLKIYEKDYLDKKLKLNLKSDQENNKNNKNNQDNQSKIIRTNDKEFNPHSTYTPYDYNFLNLEYERIENELNQMVNLDGCSHDFV
jgi:hypothetical protein